MGLVLLAGLTHQRAIAWQSDASLWTAALRSHPTSPYALWRVGVLEFQAGHRDRARALILDAQRRHGHQRDPLEGLLWFWVDLVSAP